MEMSLSANKKSRHKNTRSDGLFYCYLMTFEFNKPLENNRLIYNDWSWILTKLNLNKQKFYLTGNMYLQSQNSAVASMKERNSTLYIQLMAVLNWARQIEAISLSLNTLGRCRKTRARAGMRQTLTGAKLWRPTWGSTSPQWTKEVRGDNWQRWKEG